MNNKIVIYTAIAGHTKDILRDPEPIPNVDYICFTDQIIRSKIWKIVPFEFNGKNPVLIAKYPKILPHRIFKDYEISIWVDGNVIPKNNIVDKCNSYLDGYNMALHLHPKRNCIYKEMERVIEVDKCEISHIFNNLKEYIKIGMPEKFGLYECGVLFRRHNEKEISDAMELWWNEISLNDHYRDQISFPFILWKTGLSIYSIDEDLRKNCCLSFRHHINKFNRRIMRKVA